jgi:hypothetical protein
MHRVHPELYRCPLGLLCGASGMAIAIFGFVLYLVG